MVMSFPSGILALSLFPTKVLVWYFAGLDTTY